MDEKSEEAERLREELQKLQEREVCLSVLSCMHAWWCYIRAPLPQEQLKSELRAKEEEMARLQKQLEESKVERACWTG